MSAEADGTEKTDNFSILDQDIITILSPHTFHIIILRILIILNVFVSSSVIFVGVLRPADTKDVPRKKAFFNVISLRLIFFIVGWYIVAGQKSAKSEQNFGFMDQSDTFLVH